MKITSLQTTHLYEIDVARCLLIVLLVAFHAFAIYGGFWYRIEGIDEVRAYWWLDRVFYASLLEGFVFISGYVCGYQTKVRGTNWLRSRGFLLRKLKRLGIPCVLFTVLYIVCFGPVPTSATDWAMALISGRGHLWFLPMLFWCFLALWISERLRISPAVMLPLALTAALLSYPILPFQMSNAQFYFLFFYCGYALQRYRSHLLNGCYSLSKVLLLGLLFAGAFIGGTLLQSCFDEVRNSEQLWQRVQALLILRSSTIVYACLGLLFVGCAIGMYNQKSHTGHPAWLQKMGELCFAVYLLQEFILLGLYQHTPLPQIAGTYWLPWVGFLITMAVALPMVWLMRSTRIGQRYL